MKILNFYTDTPVGIGLLGYAAGAGPELLGFVLYLGLAAYMFWDAKRATTG